MTVLVVGATGATGKHVVQQLLEKGSDVRVIVRSKQRMLELLNSGDKEPDKLTITEASLLDMSDEDLQNEVRNAESVVSCLGHNQNFQGIYGHPKNLVADATKRLTKAMAETTDSGSKTKKRIVVMTGESVENPAGTDDERRAHERFLMFMIRTLIPPFQDNVNAAEYLYSLGGEAESPVEWAVMRPARLKDGDATEYVLSEKSVGAMHGAISTRANVAKAMVDLVTDDQKWQQWAFKMPVVHDASDTEQTSNETDNE